MGKVEPPSTLPRETPTSGAFFMSMKKDAYYFPHFSNARNDVKLLRLRRVLGLEGYGIYFCLLEILRDQTDFRYPISGLAELEFELRVSKEKISTVIMDYDLFTVDAVGFFSPKLIQYLMPYLEKSERAREAAAERWSRVKKTPETLSPTHKGQVYILHCYNSEEQFIKIGSTTTTVSRRFTGKIPYQYQVICQIFHDNFTDIENDIQNHLSKFRYKPKLDFPGWAECFTTSSKDILIAFVRQKYSSLVHSHNFSISETMQGEERRGDESKQNESKGEENKINAAFDAGKPATLEQRRSDFMKKVADAGLQKYDKEMLREFYEYWIEMNEGGRKMRFEMQKVFDIGRRLATWNKNNKSYLPAPRNGKIVSERNIDHL